VEIREFITKINMENKTSILITTHMMSEADLLCDRIGIIDHGKIVALDTSTNLKKLISGADTTILKVEITNLTPELITTVRDLECVESVSQDNATHLRVHAHGNDAFDSIIDSIRAQKGKIGSIENLQPTLEDVFLHITGHEVRDSVNQKIPMGSHRHFAPPPRVR
jgi:ABC-2 type transport system ATP-binding protein